jgi:hypothetical protein
MGYTEREFHIYFAMHEDTDKGWVFADLGDSYPSRTTILVKNPVTGRSVYCEYRKLDIYITQVYNKGIEPYLAEPKPGTISLEEKDRKNVLVISEWYRRALGGLVVNSLVTLKYKPGFPIWNDLRAACQHPEPGVRVATRVAILGTWLGIVGVLFALPDDWKNCYLSYTGHSLLWTFLVLAVLCFVAGRGVKPRAGDAQKVAKAKPTPGPSAPSGQANEKKDDKLK